MGHRHYIRAGTRRKLIAGLPVKWIMNNARASYIQSIVLSAPPWLTLDDKRDIKLLAQWCKVMEIMTGMPHVLDHLIPVNHPTVCGLTVPWNYQVIPSKANGHKGNRFEPDQRELFSSRSILTCGIA